MVSAARLCVTLMFVVMYLRLFGLNDTLITLNKDAALLFRIDN